MTIPAVTEKDEAAPISNIDRLRSDPKYLLATLISERNDLVAQMKRSKGRYGEGRELGKLDRRIKKVQAIAAAGIKAES